ncbi:MAG: hypothetical protein P1V81_15620 [Planctomycetota bacterium]|nr:hypothetical protein [Planctomycetota bacterium]
MGLPSILLLSLLSQTASPAAGYTASFAPVCAWLLTQSVPADAGQPSEDAHRVDVQLESVAGLGFDPAATLMAGGESALLAGDPEQAIALLARARELAPGEAELARLHAHALGLGGRLEDALDATGASGSSAWTALERARWLVELDRRGEAMRALDEALSSYPTLGSARLLRLRLWVGASGEPGSDISSELARLELQLPGAPEVALLAAEVARGAGQPQRAAELLRHALERPRSDAWARPTAGGSPGDAAPLDAPAERALRLALAAALGEAGDHAQAWLAAEPLLETGPDADDLVRLARLALAAGEQLEALATLGAALVEDPTHGAAMVELGQLLGQGPELTAALAARHLTGDPTDVRAWLAVLEAERAGGRDQAALARLDTVPAALRGDPELRLFEAGALRRSGQLADAATVLAQLLPDPAAAYELGLVDFARGHFEAAAASFAAATAASDDRGKPPGLVADAHYGQALCLERLERYADAADALDRAVAARADFLEAWLQLGLLARYRLGDVPRARAALARYFELGGDDPELRRWLEAQS